MARVIIDGELDVINVTSISDYTDDLLGVVSSVIFVRVQGTIKRKRSAFNGNKLEEFMDDVPFDKIVNATLLREYIP